MEKYAGITRDDKNNIMVRFKYLSKTYSVKNFTKLYGSKTKAHALNKLNEIKLLISRGVDPFSKSFDNLDEIFQEKVRKKRLNKEWTENTISNYQLFYDLVLKKKLGSRKLNKITYLDLLGILESKKVIDKGDVWKNRLKQILNPIYKDALKAKLVYENPCDNLESAKVSETTTVQDKVVDEDLLPIAQKLYLAIDKYPVKSKKYELETKTYLYMVLLTAHRIGEVILLTKENCYLKQNKIISGKEISKTKVESDFPIPKECLDYIKGIKSGKLFPKIQRSSVYLMFQRLLSLTDIDVIYEKKMTVHDTRSLMFNIMVENGISENLADSCLEHKIMGVKKHYQKYKFSQKKEAYEIYWNLVRNDEQTLKKEEFRKEYFKHFELEFEKAWEQKNK